MHFILKIAVDEKGNLSVGDIIDHCFENKVLVSRALLENTVRKYITDECGRNTGAEMKIIDIKNFSQICEPSIDTMLVYRIDVEPNILHVYRRKTIPVPGWIMKDSTLVEFRKVQIFALKTYDRLSQNITEKQNNSTKEIHTEMVLHGEKKLRIPKSFTIEPMCKLIDELKKFPKFADCRKNLENPERVKQQESRIEIKMIQTNTSNGIQKIPIVNNIESDNSVVTTNITDNVQLVNNIESNNNIVTTSTADDQLPMENNVESIMIDGTTITIPK